MGVDLVTIVVLAFLEAVLSVDNAIVLALLVKHLPPKDARRALTYGLWGALVFRIICVFLASHLLNLNFVKWIGGGYLLYLGLAHFFRNRSDEHKARQVKMGFWGTVLFVELTDLAFAVDSILAAVAVSPKLWVVITGGMLGVVFIRYSASIVSRILEKHAWLETSAYLLILTIGTKLVLSGFPSLNLDFHSSGRPEFWIFWGAMIVALFGGMLAQKLSRLRE